MKTEQPAVYKRFVSMDVGIIGSGPVGESVACALADAGHSVYLGVRDHLSYSGKAALSNYPGVHVGSVEEVGFVADVIILAVPVAAVPEVAYFLGDVGGKVIIDLTAGPVPGPGAYTTAAEAITRITRSEHVVKCFNTTTYRCMDNPHLAGEKLETYVAGESKKAKALTIRLCNDLGVKNAYDIGGARAVPVLERMMAQWVALETPSAKPERRQLELFR